MSAIRQNEPHQNMKFHLGLLHFAHLLVMVDGSIDQREMAAMLRIKLEENIPDWLFNDVDATISHKTEHQIYDEGVDMLNRCTEDEKLCAFVHLYRLSESDDNIHEKEVRFLLYSLEATKIAFEDVILSTRMSKATALRWR